MPEEEGGQAEGDYGDGWSVDERQEPTAVPLAQALNRESQGKMEEECWLESLGEDVAPIDRPIQAVELAGVAEGIEGKRDKAEDVEVGGARCRPATKQDVETYGEVNEADNAGEVLESPVGGDGDDDDWGVERDAAPDDAVVCFSVDVGVLEFLVEVGA